MKNCLCRARRAVVRDCDTDLYAASAKEKAIAYSSTVARCRCNSKLSSDGNARAGRKTLGIPVECPFAAPVAAHSLTHRLPLRSAKYSSATLDFDRQTSWANGAFGRQDRHDSAGVRAVTAAPRCLLGILEDLAIGRATGRGFPLGLLLARIVHFALVEPHGWGSLPAVDFKSTAHGRPPQVKRGPAGDR
jgi:hypothetical protein